MLSSLIGCRVRFGAPCSICMRQAPHSVEPISISTSRSRFQQRPPGAERGSEVVAG